MCDSQCPGQLLNICIFQAKIKSFDMYLISDYLRVLLHFHTSFPTGLTFFFLFEGVPGLDESLELQWKIQLWTHDFIAGIFGLGPSESLGLIDKIVK